MAKRAKASDITRSSAAKYLTFVASSGEQTEALELRYEDENIWLTQHLMAMLYGVEVNTINYHIKKVFDERELQEEATIRKYRIVQSEGERQVARMVDHYNLQMIIAVGFKVNNERALQFRKWVNTIVKDYPIQGWVRDGERLVQKTEQQEPQKGIHIRLANEADVEQLTELRLEMRRERETVPLTIEPEAFKNATERFFSETLADGSFVSAIAFDGAEAVACSGLSIQRVPPSYGNPGGMRGYITNMYTRPSWRRKGLAVRLLDMLVEEARKRGCQWLYLNASAAGRPVYERYGFVPDDGEMKLCIGK